MPNPNREPNPNYTVEQVGECSIRTSTKGSPASPVDYLDPGDPGTARIGTTAVNLNAGDTRSGHYGTDESVLALYDLGFDAGETVTFDFPGGETIAAFSGSVDVPSEFVLLTPDPADDSITYETGSALNVEWEPGETEGDTNSAATRVVIALWDGLNDATVSDLVSIVCGVEDTGSFTLSADVMARLPDREPNSGFLIDVARVRKKDVEVELTDGRKGIVQLEGQFLVLGQGIRRR